MNTKTLSNLVLEFPALEKSKGKALKGGSGPGYWDTRTGDWREFNGGWLWSGASVICYGSSWHNDPYDVRNGSGNAGWDITQTGGSSGGGGGGSDYSDGPITVLLGTLPSGDGTNHQTDGFCVFKAMEVADHFFGGNLQELDFFKNYLNSTNTSITEGIKGFDGTKHDINSFVSNSFNTNTITTANGMINALSNNHPLLATVIVNQSLGHEVVVTGYTPWSSGGKFTYYDPQTGTYDSADGSYFNGVIEITGKK